MNILKLKKMSLIFKVLFIGCFSATSGAILKKCCPLDEVVTMDTFNDNLLSPRDPFQCVSLINRTQEEELEVNFNNLNFSFIGYNTLVDHNPHWPACSELSFKPLINEPLKRSQSTSCVDLMDDKYYVFTCNNNNNFVANDENAENVEISDDFTEVLKLKKCCPAGKAYDIFGRRCLDNNDTDVDSAFHDLLHKKVVLFEYGSSGGGGGGGVACGDDEALIEYHSHVHGLKIYGNSLILTKGVRDFGPEVIKTPFCIEATANSEAPIPDGMNNDHFVNRAASKFIAKVCREKTICNSIPCIQKCCPIGKRMTHDGNSTYCEEHDSDLGMKFHSFNNEQSDMEPPAFEPMGEYLFTNSLN